MTYGQALRILMKKQGVSQIELAPRLAVLSNGTVHLKDADQPSAGARSPVYTAPAVGGVFCVDDV